MSSTRQSDITPTCGYKVWLAVGDMLLWFLTAFSFQFVSLDAQSFTCSVGSGGACPVAFCPGDEVTYTCNVGTVMGATEWRLPDGTCGSPSTISLAQSGACSTLTGTCGPFSAANDGSDGTNCLVSSLTVTASTDLNNTLIQCINVDLSNNPTEVGSAVLIITGPPPPPTGVSVASCTAAGSVTLEWKEPTVTGGLPIIYYLSFSPPVDECTPNCTVVGLPMFTTSLPGELSYAVSISAANCGGTQLGDPAVYMLDSSNFLSVQVATSNEITTATCSFLSEVKTDIQCRVVYDSSPDSLEYSATSQQMGSAGESVTVELTLNGAALMEDTVYYYQATLVSLECVVIEGQFTITDCTVPDVSSVSMLNYMVDGLMPGSTITYFCDGDYYLPGTADSVQVCLQSGEWNGTVPTACVKDCRESDLFEGGDDTNPSLCHAGENALLIDGGVLSCTGLTPGSTATVSCEDDYELSGEVVCQDNGTWSESTPTCEKLESTPNKLSTGAAVAITTVIVFIIAFLLGALTASLVICVCYIPRRLKAPQTNTSTSGTTSALPPGPVYEELTTEDKKRADQSLSEMEMEGNVAYGPSKKLPVEQNVAYEPLSV